MALGSITSRASLGSHFLPVFRGLVTSLETAQNFEVFGEWQHQANLGKAAFITVLRIGITLIGIQILHVDVWIRIRLFDFGAVQFRIQLFTLMRNPDPDPRHWFKYKVLF